jgi:hypothetical protein
MRLEQPILVLDNPHPGSQKRITLSLESISTIPFQSGTSCVMIPEWGQHGSSHRIPCLVSNIGTFRRTGDPPNKNSCPLFRWAADIFSNITTRGIHRPGMLIIQKLGQVSLVGCRNDWHNHRSGRKLILHIPVPIACVYPAVYSAIFQACEVHQFKIEVCLQLEMCQKELYTFENIPVV